MAEVIQRTWRSGPRKVKRTAWGYTLQVNGKQQRTYNVTWTKEEAQTALAARLLTVEEDSSRSPVTSMLTVGEAVTRYSYAKARKKSLATDQRHLAPLVTALGLHTPLSAVTPATLSAWRDAQLATISSKTNRPYAAATINRPLQVFRSLQRLAHEEWDVLPVSPKRVRLIKEPQGRVRWLDTEEEGRLLAACRASRATELFEIVTVALESGMRRSEIMDMEWPRVDLSRGVFKLEITKGGKRREVPMRQLVYEIMAAKSGPREGRVWAYYPRRAFEYAVKAAGIKDFVFHDCRHHFASWFIMQGGTLPALQKILGHATIQMTMRYAHLSQAHLRSEMVKTERTRNFSTTSAQNPVIPVVP